MLKHLLFLLLPFLTQAQTASVRFFVPNARAAQIGLTIGDYTRAERLFGAEGEVQMPLKEGTASWKTKIAEPIWVRASYEDSLTQKEYTYLIYLSPGDKLELSLLPEDTLSYWSVQGKGSAYNVLILQDRLYDGQDLSAYRQDSLPGAVFQAIMEKTATKRRYAEPYLAATPVAEGFRDFIASYLRYYPVWTYLRFKGNQPFSAREKFSRNEAAWQWLEDSLLRANPLNNEKLLAFDDYAYFLAIYLTRIKERIWRHPELFAETYGVSTTEEARRLHQDDPENFLKERIIQRHFSGKTAEFLYGVLFRDALQEKEDNLPEIFTRFRTQYPHSSYIPKIQPAIAAIEARRKHPLTNQMVFMENPDSLQTFAQLLQRVKGQTVLLDMWGTWCGPCRAELSQHAEALKQHFKGRPLTFLYVANYDTGHEAKWKELIAYYNLTGLHLLASRKLTQNIMDAVNGEGYPTYVIIRKDGSFELSRAGYPMNREKLVEQLERALRE